MALNELPKLPYGYDALEPYIDEQTMKLHHDKHHQAYFDKLNAALENYPHLKEKDVNELLKSIDEIPKGIREAVRFHGGGHSNHRFFWPLLKKDVKFKGEIAKSIEKRFGSLEKFKEEFKKAAVDIKGSGWAWLIIDKGELKIVTTQNHNSPLSEGKIPLLVLDMWEHAFYLKYQNRKTEYIDSFYNIINWNQVNENYINANAEAK